jgi:hypothetical protein
VEDGTKDQWKQYLDKHGGRKRFQNLALQLMDHAICVDWNGDISDHTAQPRWMRQTPFYHVAVRCVSFARMDSLDIYITLNRARKQAGRKWHQFAMVSMRR